MPSFQEWGIKLPDSYYEQKRITDQEISSSKDCIRQIFCINSDTLKLPVSDYNQLIYALALALRYDRCQNAIQYLMDNFQKHVYPNWSPKYNLVLTGMVWSNGIPTPRRTEAEFWNYASQIMYGRKTLSDEEKNECKNLRMMIREAYCLKQIIKAKMKANIMVTIQDYFNLLDKYELIFDRLFSKPITNVHRIRLLRDYANMRNAITHAHQIYTGKGEFKFVHWKWSFKSSEPKKVIGILEIDPNEINNELKYLAIIISQLVANYQLIHQTHHR